MSWFKTKHNTTLHVGAFSDTGQVRSENQDRFGRFSQPARRGKEEHLFIVADGMGGHERGEEASRLAVEALRQTFFAESRWAVGERLRRAFEVANERVHALATNGAEQQTVGTTCTAMALVNGHVYLAHVGDSRAYRIDNEGIQQLTRDHTLVEELRRQGVLTAEEAERHPRRHALTRALGIQATLDVDVLDALPAEGPEAYLLCSDCLAPVTVGEIGDVVRAYPPQEACERLVQMTNERGGPDNVTVLIVAIE